MKLIPLLFSAVFLSTSAFASNDELHQIISEKTQREIRDHSTRNFGRDNYPGAISIIVPQQSSRKILETLRGALPRGYIAYIGTTKYFSGSARRGHEIVVIKSKDQFDVVRVAQTVGFKHDLTNELIIGKLRKWDQLYGIDIWQAETDTIQFTFKKRPNNPEKFSREFYAFCPDLVDLGVGTLGELRKYVATSKEILLWWDWYLPNKAQ